MVTIYYYTNKENLPIFLKYGIRLSKNFNKEININGYLKQCIIGLLNPRDDFEKYNSEDYHCIKLELIPEHCYVMDSFTTDSKVIPINKYVFGTFKNPIVLIDTSIISDKISLYNKVIDVPLLYNNSEDYYYEVQTHLLLDGMSYKEAYERLK